MENLTLTELNKLIQQTLNDKLESSYWVVAEIGELSVNARGHCYLELVEKKDDDVLAKARATIWSYTYRNLSAWFHKMAGSELQAGMKILANLQVTFHEVYGLSLNIKDIDASYTIGERERKRQETLLKLEQDGVLDMNKQLELPLVPQRIAVISSPTAAGYEDFENQLANNVYGYQLDVAFYPAIMQGEQASESIIAQLHAIMEAKDDPEIVVLIRGGGSKMDLDCFDDYDLSTHLAQFPIPVITGIGHERDETISDIVAHTDLKTPTAVADFLLFGFQSYEEAINDVFLAISIRAKSSLNSQNELLAQLNERLGNQGTQTIIKAGHKLHSIYQNLVYLVEKRVLENKNMLDNTQAKIELLDPINVFKRGYSFSSVNGKALKQQKIKKGDTLKTYTQTYTLTSEINEVVKDGKDKL